MGAPSSASEPELVLATWIETGGRPERGGDGASAFQERPLDMPVSARILVVEDEHVVGLDLQVRLTRMGHTVAVAYSGEEAVDRVAGTLFDLVLMDIRLKGALDGIEAARMIRQAFDVPIIYLTAYADNQTLDRARYTEPYGYILKPFNERELKAAIEIALQRHAQDRMRSEQQRLQRFLAEASAHMVTSLDYKAVACSTAELIVPRYADWCLIHLREREDAVPAFAYAHPSGHASPVSPARILETIEAEGRPELRQIADPTTLGDMLGVQYVDVLRELGARSLLCVPLMARQEVLGSLAFVSGRMRPRYGSSDLAFAEDMAQRLAIALDNALLYRQAERAIVMRDDVLAIVSHDLRTPLWTIMMAAESLIADREVSDIGKSITRSADRMNRLIGDLLDASAINAGRLTLEVGTHRADELVREAIDTFRSQAEMREIVIDGSPADAVTVSCDRDRILQVLSNLIDNALRYTPRKGRVVVSAERRGDDVHFAVKDTGPGIADEALPHLFDRFWRLRARRDGAGLGLFIAKGILIAHGGTLHVDTELGKGSTFCFDLKAEE
jgi:signal transduction histidine kinase/CheY-like chemotaxis protein